MRRILVVRPEPGASATARRLADAGFEPVLLPMTRIAALEQTVPDAKTFDAVAATSANAFRHASAELAAAIAGLRCFAVGAETARSARRSGMKRVEEGGGDAAALAALIGRDRASPGRVLYICGRVRRPDFEEALARAGIAVIAAETYDTLPVAYDAAAVEARLGRSGVDAILVHSAVAADALVALLDAQRALFGSPHLVAISPRVARTLAPAGLETAVAAEPDDASMLSCLRGIMTAAAPTGCPFPAP